MAEISIRFTSDTTDAIKNLNKLSKESEKSFNSSFKKIEDDSKKLEKTFNQVYSTVSKSAQATISTIVGGLFLVQSGFLNSSKTVNVVSDSFSSFSKAVGFSSNTIGQLSSTVKGFSNTVFLSNKNIFGLSVNLGTLSIAFAGLANAIGETDNKFLKIIKSVSIFSSIVTGTFAAAISAGVIGAGKLSSVAGSLLVGVATATTKSFSDFEKQSFVFDRSLVNLNNSFDGVIGSSEVWNGVLNDLSKSARILPSELNKVANEIISVGAPLGLTTHQMIKLTEATADYAKSSGKDAFTTSVNLLSALNGNSQAVLAYGIKLSEANLKQFALTKGITKSIEKLSESEKIQLRYNLLLKQYEVNAKGAAAALGGTLIGAQEALDVTLNQANVSFGRGASIIENYAILALGLDKVLSLIPDTLISITGFLTALTGRLLQVIGLFLKWSFVIIAVTKGLKILNFVLSRDLTQSILSLPIPIVNRSILGLLSSITGSTVQLRSFNDVLKTLGQLSLSSFKNISKAAASFFSFSNILAAIGKIGGLVIGFLKGLGAVLLAIATNPIFLAIGALVGILLLLKKAFEVIEERTKVFSTILNVLNAGVSLLAKAFEPVIKVFTSLKDSLIELVNKGIGYAIDGISALLVAALDLVKSFPGIAKAIGIDSKGQRQLASAVDKIQDLREQLKAVNFDISKLKPLDLAKNARVKVEASVDLTKIRKDFLDFSKEFKNAGLTPNQIIDADLSAALKTLKDFRKQGVVSTKEFEFTRQQIEKFYAEKRLEETRKRNQEISSSFGAFLGKVLAGTEKLALKDLPASFAGLGASALQGAKGAQAFLSQGLGAIADSFLPGIGGAVASIVDVLAQGPDQVKALVREFAKALPDLIIAITESFPVLIEELITQLIPTLVERAPEIIEAMVRSVPQLFIAINRGFIIAAGKIVTAAGQFLIKLVAGAGRFISEILRGAQGFVGAILEGAKRFISEIGKAAGGGIKKIGGGITKGIKKLNPFAEGGVVPSGFPNDTYPAALTSGEAVVPNNLVDKLEKFLNAPQRVTSSKDGMGSSVAQNLTIVLQVGEEELARTLVSLDRRGFRLAV